MIRKYLVIGKHVYLTSIKREVNPDNTIVTEILMPIQTFWKVRDLLKKADYMLATGDDQPGVAEIYRKVFQEVMNYGIAEKDRAWLLDRSKTQSG